MITTPSGSQALITGAGMLGAHTARRLLELGWEVTLLDRAPDRDYLTGLIGDHPHLAVREADLTDDDAFDQVAAPDVVIHTAALIGARAQSDPLAAIAINVSASTRLALWAAGHGARRFVAVSTWGVHDMGAPGRLSEESPLVTPHTSYYGATKMAMEEVLGAVASSTGIELVVFRPTVMYGYGPHVGGALGSFAIENAIMDALRGEDVVIPGHLLARTELLYVDDAAAAIVSAATRQDRLPFERFVLGPQQTTTADELAEAIRVLFPHSEVRVETGGSGMTPPSRDEPTDVTHAMTSLGIAPPRNLEEGLDSFIRVVRAATGRA